MMRRSNAVSCKARVRCYHRGACIAHSGAREENIAACPSPHLLTRAFTELLHSSTYAMSQGRIPSYPHITGRPSSLAVTPTDASAAYAERTACLEPTHNARADAHEPLPRNSARVSASTRPREADAAPTAAAPAIVASSAGDGGSRLTNTRIRKPAVECCVAGCADASCASSATNTASSLWRTHTTRCTSAPANTARLVVSTILRARLVARAPPRQSGGCRTARAIRTRRLRCRTQRKSTAPQLRRRLD